MPWHEPVDGEMLATSLACAVKTYIALKPEQADAIALWILHSHLYDAFAVTPRLALTSPTKGCGKTTVLRLLNLLACRPQRAGSITQAALFRVVELFHLTLLLDENEKYVEAGSDLHALMNEGHAKGGRVLRVLGEDNHCAQFDVFSPVAYARNGKLPDDLEQRSIVIELQRRKIDEEIFDLPDDTSSYVRLVRMAARWAEDHRLDVAEANPYTGSIINRVRDNWKPLLAIAEAIGPIGRSVPKRRIWLWSRVILTAWAHCCWLTSR